MTSQGFVPPPYPQDRLDALKKVADALPGGMVDCSIGNPVDPVPEVALEALAAAAALGNTYPPTIGTPDLREAASGWLRRRAGVEVDPVSEIIACIGTKELVGSHTHISLTHTHTFTVITVSLCQHHHLLHFFLIEIFIIYREKKE